MFIKASAQILKEVFLLKNSHYNKGLKTDHTRPKAAGMAA